MELEGNSNAETSAAFLRSATGGRMRHAEPLTVIWDNSPAHRGDALRTYLTTPVWNLLLVNLPNYSPDFNAPIFDQSRHLGLGASGGNRQCVPGNRCRSTGKGPRLFRPSGPPPARSQATMSHHPSGSRRRTDRQHPSRSSQPRKCRFHLGFSLTGQRKCPSDEGRYVEPKRTSQTLRAELSFGIAGPHRRCRRVAGRVPAPCAPDAGRLP